MVHLKEHWNQWLWHTRFYAVSAHHILTGSFYFWNMKNITSFLLSYSNTNVEILMQLHQRLNSYQNPPQRKFLITIESPEIRMNTVINDEAGIFRLQKNKQNTSKLFTQNQHNFSMFWHCSSTSTIIWGARNLGEDKTVPIN